MEATIKLSNEEVQKICQNECDKLLLVPDGMQWVCRMKTYAGVVECTLEQVEQPVESVESVAPAPTPYEDNPIDF